MKIAIIPARGGSKRIPRKNIKLFNGRPMIAWSIEAAKASFLFDRIIVSTDDDEIANVAREWGAEVPFIRPSKLSTDFVGTTEVVAHAVQWALKQKYDVEAVCCIYATAPFIQANDLRRGLTTLQSGNWAFAFSVTDFAAPIFRSFHVSKGGGLDMFFPESFNTRSQDFPLALHDAAQFYWGQPKAWLEHKRIFDKHSTSVFIPRWRVQDIDSPDDWERAVTLAKIILVSNNI